MPRYNYSCKDCERNAMERFAAELVNGDLPNHVYEEEVLFETSHSINPTKKELKEATECPRCSGHNCEISLYDVRVHSYERGYGWRDKTGISRDMNKHKLETDDPYAQYREVGETDYLKRKLNDAGRHQANSKSFVGGIKDDLSKEVNKAVSSPPPKE